MKFLLITEPTARVQLPGELIPIAVNLGGVNWGREVALIVDLGEKPTAGHGVKVTGLDLLAADEIRVEVEVLSPPPGAFTAQVVTHPHTVVRIPRVGLGHGRLLVVGVDRQGVEIARQEVGL